MVSRFLGNSTTVKQEGVCLPSGPAQHYRMISAPQRPTDGFHGNSQSTFIAQQPPSQGNNQGPNLRNMAQAGPPNQSSTPPNSDIKIQSMAQPPSVNLTAYIPPPTALVRSTGQTFYSRPPPPQTQNPRMPNHRQGQQPMFNTQMQYLPIANMAHVYQNTASPFQFNQRPTSYVQSYPSIPTQPISSYQAYPPAQTPPQIYAFAPYPTQIAVPRQGGPPPPVQAAPQNHSQPNPSTMVLQSNSHQSTMHKTKRRSKAIPIIDPVSGKDKLQEMLEQQEQDESHPASGESSARQTPQPTNREVQATFAKQVAQLISNDETASSLVHQSHHIDTSDHHPHSLPPHLQLHQQQSAPPHLQQQQPEYVGGGGYPQHHHAPPLPSHHQPHPHAHSPPNSNVMQGNAAASNQHQQAVQNNVRIDPMDHIAMTSSLKAHAKEFVSLSAKEMTPVVSALTDSEEVTISKQPVKDRESPAKTRKQQQAQREQQQKEQPAPSKDAFVCEKPPLSASVVTNVVKDESTVKSLLSEQPTSFVADTGILAPTSSKLMQQEVEKKGIKKEKNEKNAIPPPSVSAVDVVENISSVKSSSVASLPSDTSPIVNAKSKHNNSQKSKEVHKQHYNNNNHQLQAVGGGFVGHNATTNNNNNNAAKPPHAPVTNTNANAPSLPVPQTQPIKPTNKSNKMRELNQKGLLKEGSDMDAFNDASVENGKANVTPPFITTEATTTNSTVIIENNKLLNENLETSQVSTVSTNSNNNNSKNNNSNSNLSATLTTTPSAPIVPNLTSTAVTADQQHQTVVLPPPRVDVTSIVSNMAVPPYKGSTPPSASESAPVLSSSRDETDRAATIANDKIVQAKNKANKTPPVVTASSTDQNNGIGTTNLNSTQKEDAIPEGKRFYTIEELKSLRNSPASNKKPEHFKIPPELLLNGDERSRLGDINRYSMGGRNTTDFSPQFGGGGGGYSGRGSSQRGGATANKRGSQSGKANSTNKGGRQSLIKVSISVKEDVRLNETENAWRPARFVAGAEMTDEDKKTQLLYKNVRGILNKLTPQKFKTLLSQIKSLTIDTCDRLQGVIDLVFEKAVDEPNFSVAYALLCRELALMQVPNTEEMKQKDCSEFVNFRKLLVTRCQNEFEKKSADESHLNEKMKKVEECTDPEKKKELMLELDELERQLRMKSVGNVRFIGELYKQAMLTTSIMVRCICILLDDKKEESLECLCKLLTTIGKELEEKGADLQPCFNTMKEIIDKKHGSISSRVRFMLQDVIDLRSAKWVPRRQDLKPKTIDQIQQEADNEHLSNQIDALPIPKRDDRSSNLGGSNKKGRANVSEDGWNIAGNRTRQPSFNISSDKLKNKVPQMNEPLGPSKTFDNWSKGSGVKGGINTVPLSNNQYTLLENVDSDKRGPRTNKDSYFSKNSLERIGKFDDGRGSRSNSQQRSRDSSATSQRSGGGSRGGSTTAPSQMPVLTKGQSAPPPQTQVTAAPIASSEPVIKPELVERRLKLMLDEYLNDCCSIAEFETEMLNFQKSTFSMIVFQGYNIVLERSITARVRTGQLFAFLIKHKILPLQDYCTGLEEVLSGADDLTIDIPKIWDYLAEIIAPLLIEESMTFRDLHKIFELLISQGHSGKLLSAIFKIIIQEKNEAFLQSRWRDSNIRLEDFLPDIDVNKFVSDKGVEFLLESSSNIPASKPTFTFDEIREKLLSFFNTNASFDDVMKWIKTNVGEAKQESHFIKALMTAILEHSIVNNKLKVDVFKSHYNYLHRLVVGSSDQAELLCLYAVQALLNKMEYPQGLLLAIFERLYEENMIPHETFISWEISNDPAEQTGKGVALKQLTSFFTSLKEADDESESSASEEA